jgi:hypothetical protein
MTAGILMAMIPDPAAGTGLEDAIVQNARRRWHARGAKRFPNKRRLFERDLPGLIRKWIVPGYAPEAGMLSSSDSIITLGSCFARQLRGCLSDLGCSSGSFRTPSRIASTFAILDFISWCVTGEEIGRGYRYDRMEDGEIREWTPEAERAEYLQGMRDAGAFVFGFGLAEIWQDRETGAVFWRGVPDDVYEAGRHEFRLTTVEENEENLLRIIKLIRSVNAAAPIVLMLSPVPIPATFRELACIPADCISKSVMRVAFDRVISRRLEGVYYWPAFEVVQWAGAHLARSAYGIIDRRLRQPTRYLVAEIVEAFVEAFYTPTAVAELRARGTSRTAASPATRGSRLEHALRTSARRLSRPAHSEP